MANRLVGGVLRAGRATVSAVGLAVVLALVLGAASAAMGATGGNFILGKANAANAASKLTASIAGPALALVNNSTDAAATSGAAAALALYQPPSFPPSTISTRAYSPNIVEGAFSELRAEGVLGSLHGWGQGGARPGYHAGPTPPKCSTPVGVNRALLRPSSSA